MTTKETALISQAGAEGSYDARRCNSVKNACDEYLRKKGLARTQMQNKDALFHRGEMTHKYKAKRAEDAARLREIEANNPIY